MPGHDDDLHGFYPVKIEERKCTLYTVHSTVLYGATQNLSLASGAPYVRIVTYLIHYRPARLHRMDIGQLDGHSSAERG